MYEICVKTDFKASHQLRYHGGKCENLHGHNWLVEVIAESEKLNEIGVVLDFDLLKNRLEKVLEPFDHARINHIKPFDKINPTAENVAKYIHDKLLEYPEIKSHAHLKRVTVGEDHDMLATYIPDTSDQRRATSDLL